MKTTKNLTLLASVCAALLLTTGCDKTDDGENTGNPDPVEEPTIVLPDNRMNYSKVSTVYSTYKTDDCSKEGATGKIIKVAGWIVRPCGDVEKMDCSAFYLANEPDQIKISGAILITATPEVAKQIKMKYNEGLSTGDFDREPDIRQKCYITGELIMETINEDGHNIVVPTIKITKVENFRVEDEVLPADVKPVDWENYNDVYNVYWNYRIDNGILEEGPTGKTLKVEGWIAPINWQDEIMPGYFKLANRPYGQIKDQMDWYEKYDIGIEAATSEVAEQLRMKFENNNLDKKCYITGELVMIFLIGLSRNSIVPRIVITDVNNVIFE